MSSDKTKFQDTFEITYEAYINSLYSDLIPLIKELQNKLGKEQISKIVKPFFENSFVEWAKKESINNPTKTLAGFVEYDSKAFHASLTVSEVQEVSENKYLVHVKECLMAKVLREMDASDIGYDIICGTDFACAPAYNPKLKLSREMTLMQGHPYCDFLYTWEEG